MKKTAFGIAYEQLSQLDPKLFRKKKPSGADPHFCLKINFLGENVQGDSGPYRQFFSDVAQELQSGALPFFVPCPNALTGGSQSRDKFILAASRCRSLDDLSFLRFVGILMGMAIRTSVLLPLDLPAFFWLPLVGEEVSLSNLYEVDESVEGLKAIRMSDSELWEGDKCSFYETFECTLGDGSRVSLIPDGENTKVTYKNRNKYCDLVEKTRLNESLAGVAAIAEGLSLVVPSLLLQIFTWEELSWRICGKPHIDVELLRRNTKYGGSVESGKRFEDTPVVTFFWDLLKELSQEDLRKFVRFAWAQERLPADDAEFARTNTRMLLKPFATSSPDTTFPKADTCFFNVMLPAYSTQEILKERLLFAINNTSNMDADQPAGSNTLFSRDGMPIGFMDDEDEDEGVMFF